MEKLVEGEWRMEYKEAEGERENVTLPFTALCGEENSVCVSDKVTNAV